MLKTFFRRCCGRAARWPAGRRTPRPAKTPQIAHPALWKVSDSDTTIYLFGTIHLLPDQYQWRTGKFDEAVRKSQTLIVETIVDPEHPQDFASAFAQLAITPTALPPILDRVPPAKRPALEAALAKLHIAPSQLDHVKTWAVGSNFSACNSCSLEWREKRGRISFFGANSPGTRSRSTNSRQFSSNSAFSILYPRRPSAISSKARSKVQPQCRRNSAQCFRHGLEVTSP